MLEIISWIFMITGGICWSLFLLMLIYIWMDL